MVWEREWKLPELSMDEYVPRIEAPRVASSRAMARPMPLEAPLGRMG